MKIAFDSPLTRVAARPAYTHTEDAILTRRRVPTNLGSLADLWSDWPEVTRRPVTYLTRGHSIPSRRAAKPPKPTDLVHSSLVIKEGSTQAVNVDYTAAEVSPATVKHLTADDTNPDVVPNKFGEDQFQLFSYAVNAAETFKWLVKWLFSTCLFVCWNVEWPWCLNMNCA